MASLPRRLSSNNDSPRQIVRMVDVISTVGRRDSTWMRRSDVLSSCQRDSVPAGRFSGYSEILVGRSGELRPYAGF